MAGGSGTGEGWCRMSVPFAGSGPVRVLEVESAAYRRAFELFLAGTDEKEDIEARLVRLVEGLGRRRVFLDVGAGEGRTTARLAPYFERTVAVEPSAAMREALRRTCPGAAVLRSPSTVPSPGSGRIWSSSRTCCTTCPRRSGPASSTGSSAGRRPAARSSSCCRIRTTRACAWSGISPGPGSTSGPPPGGWWRGRRGGWPTGPWRRSGTRTGRPIRARPWPPPSS
ncbi:class I SAM-dependent methyltransferase [Streptomyces mobaraensis]|uniref:Class I SAM-dependent methyltransferase n=1 Tax=Streptomyces mobaraensis TaxID=35621 RepID=A0A5N5VZE9_STRMB|nr:class I SAM-dependent methyltransferase [Streptomyces mobaraensis]